MLFVDCGRSLAENPETRSGSPAVYSSKSDFN